MVCRSVGGSLCSVVFAICNLCALRRFLCVRTPDLPGVSCARRAWFMDFAEGLVIGGECGIFLTARLRDITGAL